MLADDVTQNIPEKRMSELRVLVRFFDIFENAYQNEEIIALTNELVNVKNGTQVYSTNSLTNEVNDLQLKINSLLPYTSQQIGENYSMQPLTTTGINKTAAIAYAKEYGEQHRNTPAYDSFVFSGDCTNFVSQILEAGGIQQRVYDQDYLGWWHKTSYGPGPVGSINPTHTHSVSFIQARKFAWYMGISYTTKDHYEFSRNVTEADVIGFDRESDGDFDHMAFVTGETFKRITINGKTYYDYQVAQHSTDYIRWVSEEKNGWETMEDNYNVTYGIIRR